MLTDDDVKHLAKLARIKLNDNELALYSNQLSNVLDYMEILNEVDTENLPIGQAGVTTGQACVPETSQVTGLENISEKDEVLPAQSSPKELLDCTELPVDTDQIRVSSVKK